MSFACRDEGGGDTPTPLFSIVMPTYNSADYVEAAIRSVQKQTLADWELLIVDDASRDDTPDRVIPFAAADPRIRFWRHEQNRGAACARNTAIARSRGRYIAFLDSDDLWLPDKLARQKRLLESTGAPLVYGAYEKIDAQGRRSGRIVTVPEGIDYQGLLDRTVIATVTAVYDTRAVGRMPMPDLRKRQDYALWLRILRTTGAGAIGDPHPLALLRRRPGSLSSNKLSAALWVWRVYRHSEGLGLLQGLRHFVSYALHATVKSRI